MSITFDSYFDALEACSSHVKITRASPIDAGWDNLVMDVNGEWIFKFPRDDRARRLLAQEERLLPALNSSLPIGVPEFEFLGDRNEAGEPGYAGYRKLQGVALTSDHLDAAAGGLASALGALHRMKLPESSGSETVEGEAGERMGSLRRLPELLTSAQPLIADRGKQALCSDILNGLRQRIHACESSASLTHSDLTAEHILVDPETSHLVAIVDWGHACMSDPAVDLAGIYRDCGEAAVKKILEAGDTEIDAELLERTRIHAALEPFARLESALVRSEREEVELCMQQILVISD